MNEYENMTKEELLTRCLYLEEVVKDRDEQIKSLENHIDYQNKVITKYKDDLKKIRIAYIQSQVCNVMNGSDNNSFFSKII